MSDVGKLETVTQGSGESVVNNRSTTVLYVALESEQEQEQETAVGAILSEDHGMEVHLVHSLEAARTRLAGDTDDEVFDCIVCELVNWQRQAVKQAFLEFVQNHQELPIVVYTNSACDTECCSEWFQVGIDDVLSKETDTDRFTVLAHRIEQCVALRRERTITCRYKTAIEQMDHAVLIADTEDQIEYVNHSFEELFHYDRDALTGQSLTVFRSVIEEEPVRKRFYNAVSSGNAWSGELTIVHDQENRYPIEIEVSPIRNANDELERLVIVGKDITDRKAHERALADAWQKYRGVMNASPDAIFIADADSGEIIETNDTAADLLERSKTELIGMHQSELHPSADRDRYQAFFERHVDAGEGLFSSFENGDPLYVETADGTQIPVEINATCIELGDQTLIQGHFRDVSDRYEREQTLKAIVETIPDLAIVYTANGEHKTVLTGREEILVESPETLHSRNVHEVLPEETATRILDTIQTTLETGDTQRLEYSLTIDDELHWFEARAAPLQTGTYDSECVVFLVRDITDRKQRERKLRSFRKAVEQAGHAIMITDTDGTIEYVNPAFETVTGYTETEALGQRPSLLQSGNHDDEFYQELWRTILNGDVWEGELINERKNGEQYYIDQTIAPITETDGSIERFVAVNTDITDRKQYEYQLKQERDRLKEFARTVAHDLRNPLSIALGHVEMAHNGDGEPSDLLDTSMDALERMETLIGEVLTLSKQGRTVREPESVYFNQVLQRAWKQVETADATLSVEDDLAEWTINADESRFCELLENLINNAVEHAGPDVTIRVGQLTTSEGFFIADNGPGIPPQDHNRIFESGFTTAEDGTGFGLSIVKQIADAHGWDITVTEATSGGARFEITTQTITESDPNQSEKIE